MNKISFKIIFIFLLFLFIPELITVSNLSSEMINFYQIKKLIINVKKINNDYIDNITNWIIMYSDMYLVHNRRYNYAICMFKVESNFNSVYGDNGKAFGFGQIHLDTGLKICKLLNIKCAEEELKYKLINDIKFNIQISLAYLGFLEKYYHGDIDKAIIAYNIGEGFLDRFMKQYNRIPKTRHYIRIKRCLQDEF